MEASYGIKGIEEISGLLRNQLATQGREAAGMTKAAIIVGEFAFLPFAFEPHTVNQFWPYGEAISLGDATDDWVTTGKQLNELLLKSVERLEDAAGALGGIVTRYADAEPRAIEMMPSEEFSTVNPEKS